MNALPPCRSFLNSAEKNGNVLPSWRSEERRELCEEMALDKEGKYCIHHAVEKHDVQEAYNDTMMPMNFRLFTDQICGFLVMRGWRGQAGV